MNTYQNRIALRTLACGRQRLVPADPSQAEPAGRGKRLNALFGILLSLTISLAGCGGEETDEKTGEKTGEKTTAGADSTKGSIASGTELTPDATIDAFKQAIADDDLAKIWSLVPSSYQSDINGLVHQYADTMDAEIYKQSMDFSKKLAKVLREKKEFVLASPMMQQATQGGQVSPAELSAQWDAFVGMLETIVNSELGDLDKLKAVDTGELLAGTGEKVLGQFASISENLIPGDPYQNEFKSKAQTITAKLISVEGDTATIEYSATGLPATEKQMTRVDGRWVPAEMAEDWDQTIAMAKQGIAAMPEQLENSKPQLLGMLGMLNGIVSQLDAAETQEEFDQAMNQAMLPIMGMMGGLMGGGAAPPPERTDSAVIPDDNDNGDNPPDDKE